MVTTTGKHHRYTYADYVGMVRYSDVKLEFLDGEIYAMAEEGSEDHSAIAAEVLRDRWTWWTRRRRDTRRLLVVDAVYRNSTIA